MAELIDQETGRVVTAQDADAAELVSSGLYRAAKPEEVQAELRRAELSDVGSTVAAGLEGAASEATLGGYDALVQSGALGEQFAEESRLRAEYNPTARGIGGAAGILGVTALTGGGGAAAALAERGAASLARGVASSALRNAVVKGAGVAAAGTVEGAVFGVGHELGQAALEHELDDPERLAQRLAVAGGMGALMGGGFGFIAGAAGGYIGSKATAAKESVLGGASAATGAEARAVGQVAGQVDNNLATSRQILNATDNDMAIMAELTPQQAPRTFSRKATSADKLNDVRQSAVKTVATAQDEVAIAADANRAALSVGEKPGVIRKIMADGGGPSKAVREPALAKMSEIEGQIQELVKRADVYEIGGASAIKQLGRKMESAASKMDDLLLKHGDDAMEEAVQAFRELDNVKRELGRAQVQASRGMNGSQEAMLEIQGIRENLRGFLESADVWGDGVAGFQTALNAKWSPLIDLQSSFNQRFALSQRETFTGIKSAYDKTKFIGEADRKAISGMLKQLGTEEGEQLEALYRLKTAREVDYQRHASRLFDADAATQANVAKIEDAAKRTFAALDEARQTTLDAAEFAAQQETISAIPIVGETIAKSRKSLAKLLSAGEDAGLLSQVGKASADGNAVVKSAASGIIERVKAAGSAAKGAAKKSVPAARRVAMHLGIRSRGSRDVDAYQQIGERVNELSRPDSSTRARARDRMSQLADQRPDIAQAYEAQTQRAADFLKSKFRPAVPDMGTDVLGHTRPPQMDPASVSTFLRYVDAVQDPQGALDRAAAGTITREDVEVLRSVYPAVYSDLVGDVMDQLANVQTRPPYEERIRLGLLLGVPTDPALSPSSLQMVVASAQRLNAAGQQGGGGMGPTVSPSNAKPPEAGGMLLDPRAGARIETR